MKAIPVLAAAALAACVSLPLAAQEPAADSATASPAPPMQTAAVGVPELRRRANAAYQAGDHEAFLEAALALHDMRPWNDDYMALVVVGHALNDQRAPAYEMMLTMQRQGLSHDFNATSDTESIRGTEAYEYINDVMVRAGEPEGVSNLEFTLPGDLLLPTAIEWDPTREAFLVANARDGAVFRVGRDGATEALIRANEENGLWGIFGMTLDVASNRLWLTSSASRNYANLDEADLGRSALFEFELDSLELVRKYPVPADGRPHRLGDLAIASGGDVYAADTVLPIIYRLEQGADRLRPFVASGDNVSLRGVTASDDGRMLYVADYEMGILALDLEDRRALRLTGPETLNFGGIEGLFYWNNHLVMIQNGIEPQRIMRLRLTEDGTGVDDVAPLAIAQPHFYYPNFGTVVEDDLVFFANSHWVRDLESPEPIQVASTSIAEAPSLRAPDVEKFWDEYYEAEGIEPPEDAPGQ